MEYNILIRPEAEKDLADVFVWYEDKRQGLGHDFLLRVEAGLHFIARNPYRRGDRESKKQTLLHKFYLHKLIEISRKF